MILIFYERAPQASVFQYLDRPCLFFCCVREQYSRGIYDPIIIKNNLHQIFYSTVNYFFLIFEGRYYLNFNFF